MTTNIDIERRLSALEDAAQTDLDRLADRDLDAEELRSWLREGVPDGVGDAGDVDDAGNADDADDTDDADGVVGELHDLAEAVDEFEDVVRTVDPATLAAAVDADEVDADDVRAVLDPREELDLRDLLAALDLPSLWAATDVRDLWREVREFRAEAGDVDLVADEDGSDRSGDEGAGRPPGVDADGDGGAGDVGGGAVSPGMADELSEKRLQSTVLDAVEEFREALLEARSDLAELSEANRERTADGREDPRSRNPTAVSTMPTSRPGHGSVGRYSTVPEETRYSTAPNGDRIYGRRFESVGDGEGEDA